MPDAECSVLNVSYLVMAAITRRIPSPHCAIFRLGRLVLVCAAIVILDRWSSPCLLQTCKGQETRHVTDTNPSRILHSYTRDIQVRRLTLAPYVYMFGFHDGQYESPAMRPLWAEVLETANIVEGITRNADLVNQLRSRGKVFAYHVSNTITENDTVEDTVQAWSAPYRDDLGGSLPGGFDAISIDELHSCPDSDPKSNIVIGALRELRAKYPDKLIFAAGVWKLAYSGLPDYGYKGLVYDAQLIAARDYCDLYLQEVYLNERNPQFHLFRSMARNLSSRVPGLLSKTIFLLGIPQSSRFPYGDCSPYVEFRDYLDEQFHLIRSSPDCQSMPGIGFWVFYRARPATIVHAMKLARHYFLERWTNYYGDGDYSQLLANPSFEDGARSWQISPGTTVVKYDDVAELPAYHYADFATHEKQCVKTVKGRTENQIMQIVRVEPKTTYTLSAWVTGSSSSAVFSAGLSAVDSRGKKFLDACKEFPGLTPQNETAHRWRRVALTFTTASDTSQIRISLNDSPATEGTVLYWDFVELEKDYARLPVPRSDW